MLGLQLKATYCQTRKINGEKTQKKFTDTVNPWRIGRFMPLNERSWSLNTYGLSKVWFKSHCVSLRAADINSINTAARKWLFADLFIKPADRIKYRSKDSGGLGLFHVKSKSTATLIKSFLETAANPKFQRSLYHQALLSWHVFEDRSITNPGDNPYYSHEFYNIIKAAVGEGKHIATMTSKEWYSYILRSELEEVGQDELEVETTHCLPGAPQVDLYNS